MFAPSSTQAAFPDGWSGRCELVIQSSQVAADHTDFPLLITEDNLPSDMFDADGDHPALNGGGDIRFSSDMAGTTQLSCEVVTFVTDNDPANGEAEIWVNVPSVSGSVNTSIWIWYDNPGESQPARDGDYGSTSVWNSNYAMVQHMNQDPSGTAPQMIDATANVNDGTSEGSILGTALVPAKIGDGIKLDAVDDMIRVSDSPSLDSTNNEGTFALWINWVNPIDGDHQLVMCSSNRYTVGLNDGYEWGSQGDGDHFFYPWGGDHDSHNLGANPFTADTWHYLVVTFDYATTNAIVYVDASPMTFSYEGLPTYWSTLGSPDDWLWGGNPDRATRYLNGTLDEIHVSDVAYSEEWITTSYNNQNLPGVFVLEQTPSIVSISSGGATFSFGTNPLDSWLAADSCVLTNDGTVSENFVGQISQFTDGTNDWGISNITNGADIARAQWSTAGNGGPWNDIAAYESDFTIATNIAVSDSVTVWFRIQTPVTTSSNDEHSSSLTVTAEEF